MYNNDYSKENAREIVSSGIKLFGKEMMDNAEKVLLSGLPMFGEHGVNGHFWCETPDGDIIDTWCNNYDCCRESMNIKNKKLIYYPCPNPVTTAIMMKKVKTLIDNIGGEAINAHLFTLPRTNMCMFNAMAQVTKTGGTLRFGSLAINTDKGSITCWLSGHEDLKTYADYTQEEMPKNWTIREEKKATKHLIKNLLTKGKLVPTEVEVFHYLQLEKKTEDWRICPDYEIFTNPV